MIPVKAVAAPDTFDANVRVPGLDAIAELVGEPTSRTRPGPKRAVYPSRDDIPPRAFPTLWTAALPDLRKRYHNVCAYLALYLHKPGKATVDHFVPKSSDWSKVYDWDNYRLCDPVVNGTKGNRPVRLDPFTIGPGLFALEFVEFQVVAGPKARGAVIAEVEDAITTLGLNLRGCCEAREEYVVDYLEGPPEGIALARLERRAPFIAQELRRQGLLVRGDT